MKNWAKVLAISISTAIMIFAALRGGRVPFADQWPLFEALRNTAAIVFAVVGAWLAIVYPERLRVGLRSAPHIADASNDNATRIARLLVPVVHSTVILGVVLLVGLFAPLLRDFIWVREHIELCRAISYSVLAALTLLQVWTVILTLVPASEIQTSVLTDKALRETTDSLFSRSGRSSKRSDK